MAGIQHEVAHEKGGMVEDELGKEWEMQTQLFADDAHHCPRKVDCTFGSLLIALHKGSVLPEQEGAP